MRGRRRSRSLPLPRSSSPPHPTVVIAGLDPAIHSVTRLKGCRPSLPSPVSAVTSRPTQRVALPQASTAPPSAYADAHEEIPSVGARARW